MKRLWLALVACVLAGCQSTLKGVKLDDTGSIASQGARNGIPYALTRPKFQVLKDDKDKYSVTVTYVADASQRYSLRIDPALLADTSFKMTWAENGSLSGLTASATDQTVPTMVAVLKMAASVATGLAAPIGLAEGPSVDSGCLTRKSAAEVIICAMARADFEAQKGAKSPPCPMTAELKLRMAPFISTDDDDTGDVVASLYPLSKAEEACFRATADELTAEAKDAIDKAAPPVDAPQPSPPLDPAPITGLKVLALSTFDTDVGKLQTQYRQVNDAAITKNARGALDTRIAVDKADDLKALIAAVTRYRTGEHAWLYTELGVTACVVKTTTPPSPPCVDDAIADTLDAALNAAGLETTAIGERMDLIARAKPLAKGLRKAADLDATEWRKRHIARLDRDEAAAIKTALLAAPTSDPSLDPAVQRLREQKAAAVELSPQYKQLFDIRQRLKTLPSNNLDSRQSPTGEYTALRTQAENLEAQLAAKLAAATPPAAEKTPADLPPDAPWVAERCVATQTKTGWAYLEGRNEPEYVIVLRRADGSKAALDPKTKGCGA
jgi:hypothetical protein